MHFFGEMVEVGFHQIAIQMVAEGSVDGAAIDSQVLGLALSEDPALVDRIRVVDVLGPSTVQRSWRLSTISLTATEPPFATCSYHSPMTPTHLRPSTPPGSRGSWH